MITVSNIVKTFDSDAFKKPVKVLKGVNFSMSAGKTIGFLGANGAGKTTLMKIIMGFIHPTSGHIKFDPALGKSSLDALKNIGYMPERPYFYPHLKGQDFIEYMGALSQMNPNTLDKNARYWASRLKIDHALDRELKGYSKGMLQRIGFMAALIHDPKVIILDEPLSGLDPLGRKEFKDVIREIKNQGKTIFFSSHIVADIEEVCDEVIFLKEGEIVFQGDLQEIYNQTNDLEYEATIVCENPSSIVAPEMTPGFCDSRVLSEKLVAMSFKKSDKEKFLKWCHENKLELNKLSPIGQTLEEVFYFSDQDSSQDLNESSKAMPGVES